MELQTKIPLVSKIENQINYHSKILLLGSCFAQSIGKKIDYYKFQSCVNPFGILFHPKAIEHIINKTCKKELFVENDIFFYNEQWHTFDAHSSLSNMSKHNLLLHLNNTIQDFNKQIKEATHIILTLGTAWTYKNIETGKIVANCHKLPQNKFKKKLLSVKEIEHSLKNTIEAILGLNPNVSIIFTVSPVRHIKDGFVENTQSKSHLLTAIHQVIVNQVYYFPSYEIMMDQLRDYRFYKQDMLHPNKTAVHYIWKCFNDVWMSDLAKSTMDDVAFIQKGLLHKPFNPNSDAHLTFLEKLKVRQQMLIDKFSFIKFS